MKLDQKTLFLLEIYNNIQVFYDEWISIHDLKIVNYFRRYALVNKLSKEGFILVRKNKHFEVCLTYDSFEMCESLKKALKIENKIKKNK